jgi:serine/threonine protein phosphatase 1
MATFAIGDVHGNRRALDDLLTRLDGEVHADDTVVFLGDYIDRGPDSKECIDRILRFRSECRAAVVTLMGNHEDWFLRTLGDFHQHSWLTVMRGFTTVASYSEDAAEELARAVYKAGPSLILDHVALPYQLFFDALPAEHLTFFKELKLFHRTPEAVCAHGGVDPRKGAVESQRRGALIWGANSFPDDYTGPDMVLYGHWDNAVIDEKGWPSPAIGLASIGVDTISHGVLTAVRLPDRRVFQSDRFR